MHDGKPILTLEKITKIYSRGDLAVAALRGVDLSLQPGEFVAIMGPSGSGKSTLMNLIGCLDKPTSGTYTLLDKDVSSLSRDELSRIRLKTLGFVFQGFNLLSRTTALENVELPLLYAGLPGKERQARALEALGRVGLSDRAGHTSSELSGGQQQRVAIARALVSRPSVLLADEPTGNLDSRTSLDIMALLQALNADGLTIVLVTHEPDIAAFAKRLLFVKDGRIRTDQRQTPLLAEQALAEWHDTQDEPT